MDLLQQKLIEILSRPQVIFPFVYFFLRSRGKGAKNSFNKNNSLIHFFIFKTYPSKYFFVITNHYFIVCDYVEGKK